ncbi:MAG TPA: hypothetical protein VFQ54_05405, partial [Thermomicrobiales bacterium]|nr:hypothetical protein [Thermomicrobiales bacterium]
MDRLLHRLYDSTTHHSHLRVIIRETIIIGSFAFFYFYVRGLMDAKRTLAMAHEVSIIHFEQHLGIFVEPDLQSWIRHR